MARGDGIHDAWHESVCFVLATFIEKLFQPMVILPLVVLLLIVMGLMNPGTVDQLARSFSRLVCR